MRMVCTSTFFIFFIIICHVLNVVHSFVAICFGPFIRLAADIQELAICCLYYFSFLDPLLLQSLVSCCLCKYHGTLSFYLIYIYIVWQNYVEDYMSSVNSLCHCSTGEDLKPVLIFRIFEVLQSSFRAGHILVADYISFHITLLSQFRVLPGNFRLDFLLLLPCKAIQCTLCMLLSGG